ncbi:peptidase MA family metallohydrolase [Kribbella sp. NBC_00889]|uniref:peptidase MA family metallohydrolase n=1 Tax=Kribbella sp. NBC_00889 TaxID=2975974 RepID=UPI00386DFEBA|nr:basic secretory family protein [Kribbella sp. NBC_00889]
MKHPRRLFAGVAVLALAASASVVVVRLEHGGSTPGSSAAAVEATPAGELTDAQKAVRKREVDAVLARRSAAVLKGDVKGFLAAVDPKQPQLVARQRTLFTNLRQFAFTSLTYFVGDERLAPAQVARYGPTTFSTRVMMRYQLTGLDAKPVQTDVGYTFVRRGTAWVLVADTAIDETLSPDGHRQPWDFGPVAVARRGKVVVVVDRGEKALGNKIAKASQGAVDGVRRHWPRPWNGAVMVVAMSEPQVLSILWTYGSGSGWTVAAKAVSLYDGDPFTQRQTAPVSSRIVVNPAVRQQLDRDLLVHEMTHVATLRLGARAPLWLVEGIAEYVRTASIEDDPKWTVDPYRKSVRTKYLSSMKVLPGQPEFNASGDRAYGQSWWITSYLEDQLGETKVAALYADLAQHNTTQAAFATILKKHTGKTPAQLVAAAKKFKG